jgi:NMD protein affecting ribosome stability and mRNA decay
MIVYDVKYCDNCQSSIAAGQRWVREKIYNPRSDSQELAYHHFHAEPFGGQEASCWEKHQMGREIARTAALTTKWALVNCP